MPRTEFNSTIEKIILENTKSPITDGVQKCRGFSLSNGRQIALRREDTTEINIWTEKVDLSDDELAKFRREYAADAPRGHSFRTHAPRLHVGYPTYVYKFDLSSIEEETVKKLVRKLLRLMKKIGDDGSNIAIPSSAPKGVAFPPITEQMQVDKDTQRLSTGEREAVVKVRYGQGAYRDELLKKSGAQCWMSGIEGKQLLIASHIKPWFQSKDDEQARGDPDNGLLLSALWDAAFDGGLICFGPDYALICANDLSASARQALGITTDTCLPEKFRCDARKEYLKYHRENCFRQGGKSG